MVISRSILRSALVVACSGGIGLGKAHAQTIPLDRPMGEPLARAMLGRIGYGATVPAVGAVSRLSPRAYIEQGVFGSSVLPAPVVATISAAQGSEGLEALWQSYGPGGSRRIDSRADEAGQKELQRIERQYAKAAIQARLLAMANSPNQAHEALLSFWLNHFSVYAPKNFVKLLAGDYARQVEAAMKEDSFEALLRASFYHPAMQFFLDNVQSTAPSSQAARMAANRGRNLGLNENLARELMELHTLGVDGGYSQKDVQELARIITGAGVWSPRMVDRNLQRAGAVRKGLFLFDPRRHDFESKRLLGQNFPAGHGLDEIDRALHVLATQATTARHISRKLALRFVSDNPAEATVTAMSDAFSRSSGKISETLAAMIGSPEFAPSLESRTKFKEPLDQILSAARASCQGQSIANADLLTVLAMDAGQAPYMRTTPDGYGARESDWMSPAAVAKRIRLAMGIAADRVPLAQGAPEAAFGNARLRDMDKERPQLTRGTPCQPEAGSIEATLGRLSPATLAALEGLGPKERIAGLLSSPEALRR